MAISFKEPTDALTEELPPLVKLLMANQDAEFQRRVLAIAKQYEVNSHDPLFVVMLATGQLQTLLEDKPKQLCDLFDRWSENLYEHLEIAKRTAIKGQEIEISRAVERLIAKSERQQTLRFSVLLPAFGLFISAYGLGFLSGMVVPSSYAPVYFTINDAQLLKWAKSPQGQLAKNLVTKNAKNLERCTASKKNQFNDSGYCAVKVKIPQDNRE